jgi:hypothetical protein
MDLLMQVGSHGRQTWHLTLATSLAPFQLITDALN